MKKKNPTHFRVWKPMVFKTMCLKMYVYGQVRICFKGDCQIGRHLLIHSLQRNELVNMN